ncbi:MAG TPA: glutathione S-transferase N-terminal domain-containing protein [Gaiellaceae bacterium]|jgi:glutathione S-transferase|nr:glutathione S-transferase N-terminal domain-containing protein [Gaiellaceae bacterium]
MAGLRLYDYYASCNCYKVRLLVANLGLPYEQVLRLLDDHFATRDVFVGGRYD